LHFYINVTFGIDRAVAHLYEPINALSKYITYYWLEYSELFMKPLEYVTPTAAKPNLLKRNNFSKRALDLIIASIGWSLSLPIVIASAALIKLKNLCPAFFSHERIGY